MTQHHTKEQKKFVTNGKQWTDKEDQIIILLRDTNLSVLDISKGLFNRTRSSVAGEIFVLRRKKLVL